MATAMQNIAERRRQTYFHETEQSALRPLPDFPKTVYLELSNACNHACLFCANTHMQRKVRRMDEGFAARVLHESRDAGASEVGFYTTGEPFIHRGLAKLTRIAAGLGYEYIFVNTNGVLATPERAKEVLDAGLNSIKFSINAGSRETYKLIHGKDDFDQVLSNLEWVSSYRKTLGHQVRLSVSMVLTAQVADEAAGLRQRLLPLIDEFVDLECGDQMSQMARAKDLLIAGPPERRDQSICALPFTKLYVTQEGYLSMCCIDYHNYLAVVDASQMSISEAWRHSSFQAIRARHLGGDLAGTLCGTCWKKCRETPEPLNTDLATPIDMEAFHDRVEAVTRRRLDQQEAATGAVQPNPEELAAELKSWTQENLSRQSDQQHRRHDPIGHNHDA